MIKIMIGIGFAVIAFLDFCCCRAAALADRQQERLPLTAPERERGGDDGKRMEDPSS